MLGTLELRVGGEGCLTHGPGARAGRLGGGGTTMIYTSGPTGTPRGALRTASDPALVQQILETLRLRVGEEVYLTTGPLYHSGPLGWAGFAHALGGTIVVLRHFDAERWVD